MHSNSTTELARLRRAAINCNELRTTMGLPDRYYTT
ncbi:hypothetical protein AG1IA_02062 [Rhizoctonia solani AG-1 IA]|uniref:Uncharacterized protein n=1 Tax=Thanatephorus cucumeris (strain AG1-IA) TaxID=983506 RepID=L8X470_THACA|nr:hypothetical protein AG1IA_02062 [Rhizoctonia solani AG-1 IA]